MSPRTATRRLPLEPDWLPEVVRIVPVVRWAILVKHFPLLTERDVDDVLAVMKAAWDEWKEVYRAKVAEVVGLRPEDLEFATEEEVRKKWDGDTPMIDLPRLHTKKGAFRHLDVRCCVALCIKNFSSKVWTRLGFPRQSDAHFCPVDDLSSCVETFREWARLIDEWFYEEFFRLTKNVLTGRNDRGAAMEVTTVGLQVEDDGGDDEFDAWLLKGDGPNLENDRLRGFLAEAANLHSDDLSSLPPESFWLVIPAAVQLPDGPYASRKVLYLIHHVDDIAKVVGIGLDDSESGDLAALAALKVSRLVAGIS